MDTATIRTILDLLESPGSTPATAVASAVDSPWRVGRDYIIRTITMTYTGRLVAVYANELVLEEAAWVADSGRWADALEGGELSEVEPYPYEVVVCRGAIVDASVWNHDLPRLQK